MVTKPYKTQPSSAFWTSTRISRPRYSSWLWPKFNTCPGREFIRTVTWSSVVVVDFVVGKKWFFWKNMFQNMVWFSSIVLQNPLLRGGRKRPCLISFHDRFIAPPKEWVVWLSITHGLRGLVGGIVQPKKMKTRSLERSWKQINVSTPFWIVSCEYMILESEQGSK